MRALFGLLVLICAAAPWSVGAAPRQRPNIVVIMFDDFSPRIGALGDKVARTPAMDRLAAESVRFPNTYTTSPVCSPSRSALMTGVHQQTLGTMHMRTRGMAGLPGGGPIEYDAVPPPHVKAFPELLRRAGYYTINIGKFDYQFGEPFTLWDASGPGTDWRKRPKDRPFLAFINLNHTHESFLWPEQTQSENPLVRAVTERNRREFASKARITDPGAVIVPPYLPDTPIVREDLARLYDNVAFDDANVQRIMDALRADGVLENTIVILTGDHGDGLPRVKRAVFASGLHVPFLVRYPDRRGAGRVDQRLVSFVDLAPTVLRWAGEPVPDWMQGQPIEAARRRPLVFAATDRFDELPERRKTVIDGTFQYIRSYGDEPFFRPLRFRDQLPTMQELWRLREAGRLTPAQQALFNPLPREMLFDLSADPFGMHNLADDTRYAVHVARMSKALDRWLIETGDLSATAERDMVASMWPDLKQPGTHAPAGRFDRRGDRVSVTLRSSTPGASIGYSLSAPAQAEWRLYTRPIRLARGERIWAKAIRYGFAESPVVALVAQ